MNKSINKIQLPIDITTQIKLIAFSTTLKTYPKYEKAEPESPAIL